MVILENWTQGLHKTYLSEGLHECLEQRQPSTLLENMSLGYQRTAVIHVS